MRTLRWLFLLLLVVVAAGCGRSDDLEHRVRNYDVVEEGSAAGVTTALGGDAGSVPSLTDTNVDTTTDLTLLPGAGDTASGVAVGEAAPGSLAETLRVGPGAPPAGGTPPGGVYRQPAEAPAARREPTSTSPPPARPAREATPPSRPAEPASRAPEPARGAPPPPAEEPPAETPPPPTTTQPEDPPPRTTTQPEDPPPEDPPPTNTAPPPDEKPRGAATRETDEGSPFPGVL